MTDITYLPGVRPSEEQERPFEFHPDMQWVSNFPLANFVKSLYTGEMQPPQAQGNMPPAKPQGFNAFASQNEIPGAMNFYPSQRYLDKNLAPERSLSYHDVESIAKVRKEAEKAGILSPELGNYLLPMALVEGRTKNHGMNQLDLYASPQSVERFKKMGFDVVDTTTPEWKSQNSYITKIEPDGNGDFNINYYQQGPNGELTPFKGDPEGWKKGDIHIHYGKNQKDKFLTENSYNKKDQSVEDVYDKPARLQALMLAEKYAVSKTKLPEEAVSLYNGKGQVRDGTGKLWADADQYLEKVKEAQRMLQHPKNAHVLELYNSIYNAK